MIKKRIIESFEQDFAAYIGTRYAIGTSMGRTALFSVIKAIGVEENDEIIMPAYICEVVPNTVLKLSGVPVFVDINLTDYHISLPHLKSLITTRTKAIIIDHIFGYPEDVDAIKEIIRRSGQKIFLIEDAAHSLGAKYNGRKAGCLGDAAIFSFSKNIINISGGAVTTNDPILATKIKHIVHQSTEISLFTKLYFGALSFLDSNRINLGINRTIIEYMDSVAKKMKLLSNEYNESRKIPDFFAISTMQAYIAKIQLKKIDVLNTQRARNQKILDNALADCKNIRILRANSHIEPVITWYVIQTNDQVLKKDLLELCKKYNIYISEFWNPLSIEQGNFYIQKPAEVPNSINAARSTLTFKLTPKKCDTRLKNFATAIRTMCYSQKV